MLAIGPFQELPVFEARPGSDKNDQGFRRAAAD
jgi:hypothetical protein